ncbi:DUF4003 family protein [Thalassobacillus sp. CUG 92003]|uniref:DUF4003 family protein n=1 Tax=Thalassobacillus sp. CUG 92003 TaxID=2736641 RepID=UPI0015E66015|nr:DUF4003 family protein [Thalassobacillus sp. CUG 92003]
MVPESVTEKVDRYEDIFEQLKKKLKWQDKRSLMVVASMYVLNGKTFNLNQFIDLSDYIKRKAGMFSSLKSAQRFTTAAMLDVRFEQPKEKFHELLSVYDKLVEGKFKRGAFTYIAALVLLTEDQDGSDHQESIQRALTIYKGMQKEHPFITSKGDYPLAVMLANLPGSPDELMNKIETFYEKLDANHFSKGNDLQFLSHILALDERNEAETLVSRSISIFDRFKTSGKKPKSMHYPEIGMLALLGDATKELAIIHEVTETLNASKPFKWYKDENVRMAVNFVISDQMEDADLLETSLYTTMETVIQAQQAAMIAVMAGGAAAASSSNGGS